MMRTTLALVALAALVAAAAADTRLVKEQWSAEPQGWTRGVRAPAGVPLEAHVFVKQTNTDALESVLMAVSDPDSPRYGQHLSKEEVDELVAPSTESVFRVLAWLQAAGVDTTLVESSGNADMLAFRTTVETMEKLLGCEYHLYRHAATGHILVRTDRYTLPDDVHRHVDFVGPTIRFPSGGMPPRLSTGSADAADAANSGVTPSFLRQIYNVGEARASADGNSFAIASFLGQFIAPSDLQTFFSQYVPALEGTTYEIIGPNEASQPGVEASLDVQYQIGVAQPKGNVSAQFWSTPGQQPGSPQNEPFLKFLFKVGNRSDADIPKVISGSYGDNENTVVFEYATRVNAEFQKLGARGVSIMFSSGDAGVGGSQPSFCSAFIPTFPAASPYVTAVGGSTSSNPEVAASLSAGGFSNYWPRPQYQVDAVSQYFKVAQNLPKASMYNQTGAGFPDVAAQAQGFEVVQGGFTQPVDGTSCSSPTFSGIVALLNDARIAAGKSTLGYLNPLFYKNAAAFNDVTAGNNPGCFTNGFYAAAGWDPVTGLGTPDYQKLVKVVLALP